jgi:hypothetical protein
VRLRIVVATGVILALWPGLLAAQEKREEPRPSTLYSPPTSSDRFTWVVQGNVSLPVLAVDAGFSAWMTADNWPNEWHRTPIGFGRRFTDMEITGTIAGSIEAGVGSQWGEDPRYERSGKAGAIPRMRHAVITTFMARRPDGHLAPAWARLYGDVGANLIENAWLPPSARTRKQTVARIGDGVIDRLVSNLWDEFWPDLRKRLPARLP